MAGVLNSNIHTLFKKEVFEIFVHPGEVVEVRVLSFKGHICNENARGTITGYYDNHKSFCEAVQEIDRQSHGGIYFTLQVIDPRLLAKAFNKMKPGIPATSDNNVIAYRWLPIDLDPVRPSGIASSDAELQEALNLRDTVSTWIAESLQFPKPIKAMSGNGGHLLYNYRTCPSTRTIRLLSKIPWKDYHNN